MKKNGQKIISALLACMLFLTIAGAPPLPTLAAPVPTCEWQGDISANWITAGNWSCDNVPGSSDIVSIPATVTVFPIIYTNLEAPISPVASITIDQGASLTINRMDLSAATWEISGSLIANTEEGGIVYLNNSGTGQINVRFQGSITKTGTGNLYIGSNFNNEGRVIFTEHATYDGGVILNRGGSHTGTFEGYWLFIGYSAGGQIFNFNTGSKIYVDNLIHRYGTVNINGTFGSSETSNNLVFAPTVASTTAINFGSDVIIGGNFQNVYFMNYSKLTLASSTPYTIGTLQLVPGGELYNPGNLSVSSVFQWIGGTISGDGTTTIAGTVTTFNMGTTGNMALDSNHLVNQADANWNKNTLTLSNDAVFENDGTFNANATTTMTGGSTESFINDGTFYKKTAGTITTMDIPFTNNGIVQVLAGELVFKLGGGTYDPGETLNLGSGESLVGSGSLAANLVNAGTVSPGNSAGKITVDGNYTQETEGLLEIELGGTAAGTEYDQLAVTGNATLAGEVSVSLISPFIPKVGDTFDILTYATRSGSFEDINLPTLPAGMKWQAGYTTTSLQLLVEPAEVQIFLPVILR